MPLLSLIFGAIVGLSLGLTGGGGAIFAVPLLVYGQGVPTVDAVGISLAAVGAMALVGFFRCWRAGLVETQTGLRFALAGMLGAPIGSWIAGRLSETLLLSMFAALMVIVAVRLWRQASMSRGDMEVHRAKEEGTGPACRRDASGSLILNTRCTVLLIIVGALTGIFSGLFGVGGGFVIVPALVIFSGMRIHQAVGTSLMVIMLVSLAGVTSHLVAGRGISLAVTGIFIVGGVAGLLAGQAVGHRVSGPVLQRLFAVAILVVAGFVVINNIPLLKPRYLTSYMRAEHPHSQSLPVQVAGASMLVGMYRDE